MLCPGVVTVTLAMLKAGVVLYNLWLSSLVVRFDISMS